MEAGPDPTSEADLPPARASADEDRSPGDAGASDTDGAAAEARPQVGAGMLVLLGIIGGVYLLYTIVWFSWAQYYSAVNEASAEAGGVVGSVLQRALFWTAPFAPALWFVTALVMNRGVRPRSLVLWLLLGAIVLVPLPMFGGAA